VIVISAMLGIPPAERDTFKRLSDDIVSTSKERTQQGIEELDEYFRQVIAQRRRSLVRISSADSWPPGSKASR